MRLSLETIVEITGGAPRGTLRAPITGVAPLHAAGPGDLSFAAGPSYLAAARASRAGALLCAEPVEGFEGAQVIVADPRAAMAIVLARLEAEGEGREPGVSPGARVDPGARLGKDVHVGPGAVVERDAELDEGAAVRANAVIGRGARIGAGTVIHAGAVVGEGVRVGARCKVGPNSTLGQGGFGVLRADDGTLRSVPQVGSVVVEDDVEIGALCTVDRGTMGSTVIGRGTRMDSHCHVSHNVRIGRHCLLVAYARIAGSTVLGDGVTVAEDVGITDNVTVGAGARIGGGSRVFRNVPAAAEVWGAPARPLALERKIQAALSRLPDLRDGVRALLRAARGGEGR